MSTSTFELKSLFEPKDSARDKFLSRILGIFSEEIVHCWSNHPNAPYKSMNSEGGKRKRPTLKSIGHTRGHTLDFTFQKDDHVYIVEMKCWLEYQDFAYLTLENYSQLEKIKQNAFRAFLEMAADTAQYTVEVTENNKSKPIDVNGCILIWGSCTEEGRNEIKSKYKNLHDILTLEDIINDLITWNHDEGCFHKLLVERLAWCEYLFHKLGSLSKGQ